jgi:hypothetical protein
MAIMCPEKPKDTKSYAEKELFYVFQKQLPDDYKVFHSVRWQIKDPRKGIESGETDFVIMNSDGNLLALEVKGGSIAYDSKTDEWLQNSDHMEDPFRQGENAKGVLRRTFKKEISDHIFFPIGTAVAFPDTEVDGDMGLDKPRAIIIDAYDIDRIKAKIQSVFERIAPASISDRKLDDSVKEKITSLLYPSPKLSDSISHYFSKMDQVVDELTEEQYRVIDWLKRERKAAISGCAGSGKTLVAIEKAIRLNNEGFSVLLLCHNPYLARSIQQRVIGTITVDSFMGYISRIIGKPYKGQPVSNFDPVTPWSQYESPSTSDLVSALDKLYLDLPKFDAVIIDEGQDFHEDWWDVIRASMSDPDNGILYFFYDDRQILSSTTIPGWLMPQMRFDLSKNCRNTGEIYKIVQQLSFSMPDPEEKLAGKGKVKEWIYSSEDDFIQKLKDSIIDAERYSMALKDIVVLTAEEKPVEQSRISGIIFTTHELQKSKEVTPIDWQRAVRRYLDPRGFSLCILSRNSIPTERDTVEIKEFSCKWLDRHRSLPEYRGKGSIKQVSFNWLMDLYGRLSIYSGGELVGENNIWEIMVFFSNRDWCKTLPKPVKMYRITPIDEFAKYPLYQNIHLTNIPRFKGLEANGIVFTYYDYTAGSGTYQLASLYVGLSRAKHLLNIVTPRPILEEIERIKQKIS